jgi:hypothetical protein
MKFFSMKKRAGNFLEVEDLEDKKIFFLNGHVIVLCV